MMAKLSSLSGTIEQRVCVFGPPKSGKTQLIGALAQYYNILFFSLENGHSVLSKLPIEWQERIEIINIRDSRSYPIAIETMMKVVKGKPVKICETHSKVACPICSKNPNAVVDLVCLDDVKLDTIVVVDSITQLVSSALNHITKDKDDEYKLQLDDWGSLKKLMDNFFTQIQVAKYHIVCITHEEEVKFEDGRAKIVPVGGSSNGSRNTAKYFDHVVYANLVNKKHVIGSATDYTMSVLTGSRTDVKLETNKEASLLDIFTNWKLPNFGMKTVGQGGESDGKEIQTSASSNNTTVSGMDTNSSLVSTSELVPATLATQLTPAQQALANLKARSGK